MTDICRICAQRGWFKLIKPGSVPPVHMVAWCDCAWGQDLRGALANGSPADDRALELLHAVIAAAQRVHDAGHTAEREAYEAAINELRAYVWKQVV